MTAHLRLPAAGVISHLPGIPGHCRLQHPQMRTQLFHLGAVKFKMDEVIGANLHTVVSVHPPCRAACASAERNTFQTCSMALSGKSSTISRLPGS
jgi:hypothetical protein